MPTLPAPELEKFAAALFVAAGTPRDLAARVAASLVAADVCGHESHGVMRSARYIERIRLGAMNPAARPAVLRRHAANAVVDGSWGFGQIAAQFGTQLAIEICAEHGQAGVALQNTHHIGRLGDYAETLAAAGLASFIMTGGGTRGGSVAPFGARERLLGTNPIAMAVPTPAGHPPLVLDFATSALPEGKLAVAHANHRPVPAGCVIDRNGRPTTEAGAFYDGGALLPFGGHKGSALALMVEILATTLAGAAPVASTEHRTGNPTLILAWAIDSFVARRDFERHVDDLLRRLHHAAPAEGCDQVLAPGELEARTRTERLRTGVPLSEGVWEDLAALARTLDVTVPGAAP